MPILIDLSPLQWLQEYQQTSWLTWVRAQIQILAKCQLTPQFLLPIHKDNPLGFIKKTVQDLVPQAPIHYLALEPFPADLQGQVFTNFLQDRNVSSILIYSQNNSPFQKIITEVQKRYPYLLVTSDAKQLELVKANDVWNLDNQLFFTNTALPVLAIVSPYLPQKTGIANYVAQLLSELKKYYIPILVVDDVLNAEQFDQFDGEVLNAEQFLRRPDLHHRVLYQIGNSPAHLYALKLLNQIPGCVVMHDFFIGNALAYGQFIDKQEDLFIKSLIDSHGPQALLTLKHQGLDYCINHYPCSFTLFKNAKAVGVHTEYANRLAHQWYGPMPDHLISTLPFPKPLKLKQSFSQKQAILKKFGFPENAFIVSSFGFGTPSKLHEQIIIAWLESQLANDTGAFLIFVGEYFDIHYQQELAQLIPLEYLERVRFTGFVDEEQYSDYLAITNLAVQLRDQSRGESSAAIMDCLSSQIPVIANSIGTVIEFPQGVIWKIDHRNITYELLIGFNTLYSDLAIRNSLGCLGYEYIRKNHQPHDTAKAYHNWIERSITHSSQAREQQLITELQKKILDEDIQLSISRALILNRPALGKRQFLLDISDTAKHDKRTGIQRVVRSLVTQWLEHPPNEWHTCPIYVDAMGTYRYAFDYIFREFNIPYALAENPVLQEYPGDFYLGLDLNLITVYENNQTIRQWRSHGVNISHVVYDLLPLRYPQWFLPFVEFLFCRWLTVVIHNSDRLITDSRTVSQDLHCHIKLQSKERPDPNLNFLEIGWFHLGCDLAASLPVLGIDQKSNELLRRLKFAPTFLMVSTLEPRKGYTQTLDAFELLWKSGFKINLVIVGKVGWYVDNLVARLQSHSQLGSQLFWMSNISDEYLDTLYQEARAVICSSYAEGFGLPIIEAAHHQTPVIARDIPVFREVGGEGVDYFIADTPEQLAQFLKQWLTLKPSQKASVLKVPLQTWSQSAIQAQQFLFATRVAD